MWHANAGVVWSRAHGSCRLLRRQPGRQAVAQACCLLPRLLCLLCHCSTTFKSNKLAYCCCRTLSLGMMPLEVAFRRANLISTCRSRVSSASHRRKASLPAGPPPPRAAAGVAAPLPPPLLAEASALPAPALACSSRRSR